ncbi:ras-related protein Rab-13 [Aplysia californica]|uniref:Ras-related protein Rab-13 n=1 Tax=Aplysia californica TaxID=6500 RepID=A0ABM1A5J6_APLCA|nr:ras-related protein Rab-13 [Aplysia californica]
MADWDFPHANGAASGAGTPKFKVILLGNSGVGKTSLFLRIRDDEFTSELPSTIGIDSCTRNLKAENQQIQLVLWDTAGVERFRTLTRNFYRSAQAVLLTFSVEEPTSLYQLSNWERDTREYAPTALRFLIGTKTDKPMQVPARTIQGFARSHNCEYAFLTSAKTGQGVNEALQMIGEQLMSSHKAQKYNQQNSWLEESIHVNQGQQSLKKNSCC